MTAVELTALLAEVETQRRRFEAVDQRLLAEVEERRLAGDYGRSSTADLLRTLVRVSPGEAKARVCRAGDLGPRRDLQGVSLPPLFPLVAEACASGEISAEHAQVVIGCVDHLPPHLALDASEVVERTLVEAARHEHPAALATTAGLLLARLDPDGQQPREERIERLREFTLVRRRDGSLAPRGVLTPECGAVWDPILDALSAPVPAVDGLRDERTPGQRRHDALLAAGRRLLLAGSLSPAGGIPVTILARTTMAELHAGVGVAQTDRDDLFSLDKLLQMASDAEIIPVVCNDTGGILSYGRGKRLASRGQRLALAARDGGCCFPACDRPAAWSEVHHVIPWLKYGPTDIDNMCLLCPFHHRMFESIGWSVEIRDGVPVWTPPAWIDPDQQPIRNTARHMADFDFTHLATKAG